MWSWKINRIVDSVLSQTDKKGWTIWTKKCLMVDNNILDEILDKIKEIISNENLDDTNILIDTVKSSEINFGKLKKSYICIKKNWFWS